MPPLTVPHWLDVVIIAILAFNVFRGFRQGLIKMVFGLVGLIVATSVAMKYVSVVAVYLKGYVAFIPDWLVSGFAYFIIWVVAYLLIYQLGKLISKALHFTPAGIIDTFGGVLLGAIKGLVVVILIITPLVTTPLIKSALGENLKGSYFLQWSEPVISWGQFMIEEHWPKALPY